VKNALARPAILTLTIMIIFHPSTRLLLLKNKDVRVKIEKIIVHPCQSYGLLGGSTKLQNIKTTKLRIPPNTVVPASGILPPQHILFKPVLRVASYENEFELRSTRMMIIITLQEDVFSRWL